MRYNYVAPTHLYYAGFIMNILGLALVTFVYSKTMVAGELVPIVYLGVLTSILLLWSFIYLNKFIYFKIDHEVQKVIYGKLFYNQETEITSLSSIKKVKFVSNLFKVKIDGKPFFFWTVEDKNKVLSLVS